MKKKFEKSEDNKLFGMGEIKLVEKGADSENGTFEFVASGIKEDRYGDVVDPSGGKFKAFKKNPVMLWAHDHRTPAIAKVIKVWKDDKQVYAKAEWAPTEFAQGIRKLVEEGFLNAVSIGFLPLEREGEWPTYKYTEWELLEISIVNVPAYAEALIVEAKSMGLEEFAKSLEEKEAPAEEKKDETPVEHVEMAEKTIVLHRESGKREAFDLSEKYKQDSVVKRLKGIEETLQGLPKLAEAVNALASTKKEAGRTDEAEKSRHEALKVANKAIEIAIKQYREDKNVTK